MADIETERTDIPHASRPAPLPAGARAILGIILLGAVGAVVAALCLRGGPPAGDLPVYQSVPAFQLTDEEGRPFGSRDLEGKVWVANFMFSRCANTCPAQAEQFGQIRAALGKEPALEAGVRLISISVDGKTDTPEVLRKYAAEHAAGDGTWRFLTGEPGEVARLSQEGFQLGASGPREGGSTADITHSDRFVLVDRQGRIRGWYRPTAEPEQMERLLEDIRRLARAEAD